MNNAIDKAARILVYHQRTENGSCMCGYNELGKSYTRHLAQVLDDEGLLV